VTDAQNILAVAKEGHWGLSALQEDDDRCRMHRMSRVYVVLSDEEREKLKKLAESWSRSESNTVRLLLREALTKHQAGNDPTMVTPEAER
jgi:hypothetical protein